MKRRFLCLMLALLMGMLWITGCSTDGSEPTEPSTEDTSTTATETVPPITWTPSDQEELLIEFDPNREIYFTCQNYYYTIYVNQDHEPTISFDIISRKPLDLNTMEIAIPVDYPHWISWGEWSYEWTYEYHDLLKIRGGREGAYGYPYYLYALEQGMDFAELWAYYDAYRNASTPEMKTAYNEMYLECLNRYWDGYLALDEKDRPEYYGYHVNIYFVDENATLESLANMEELVIPYLDITIDGVTYHEEIGEVILAPPPDLGDAERDYDMTALNSGAWMPYCGGTWEQQVHVLEAKEDITITGILCLNDRLEMSDLIVRHYGSGLDYNLQWNGTDPIRVNKGDTVEFFATFTDPEHKNVLTYATKVWVFIFYETEAGTFYRLTIGTVGTGSYPINGLELYDIVFRGIDTSAYWEDYSRNREALVAYWKE